jgi:hypothetical protein
MTDLVFRFDHPDGVHALVFEDDGRVAYAYMLECGRIISHVWLYNRCPTPLKPGWDQKITEPYPNPMKYVIEAKPIFPSSAVDIQVDWKNEGPNNQPQALVSICGVLHASVTKGEKPGRCRLARISGPLAKVMRGKTEMGNTKA